MIRDLGFTRDGKIYSIKAISCPEIFDFEIPVPDSYKIIYRNAEGAHIDEISPDIDMELIRDMGSNFISIINLNSNTIEGCSITSEYEAVEYMKYRVANCMMIGISLDENCKIDDVIIHHMDSSLGWQVESLIEPDIGIYNLLREKY